MTIAIESTMLSHILDAHYAEPDEPSHRAVWIDLTLDHVGDSADVELARSGVWSGTLAGWLEVGPGIVRRVPLMRVELVDRKPKIVYEKLHWWGYSYRLWSIGDVAREFAATEGHVLPQEFFLDEPRAATFHEYIGDSDASQRAIAWARRTEVTP